jgi:hypothetical protein
MRGPLVPTANILRISSSCDDRGLTGAVPVMVSSFLCNGSQAAEYLFSRLLCADVPRKVDP